MSAEPSLRKRERTRLELLECAKEVLWVNGYFGTSMDMVVAASGLTKGAFYYHFPSKHALAAAVIDEAVAGELEQRWLVHLREAENPLAALIGIFRRVCTFTGSDLRRGCAINNLAQELSAVDEDLRQRVDALFTRWIDAIADGFTRSQQRGYMKRGADVRRVATFSIACFEGAISLGKSSHDPAPVGLALGSLIDYLEALRTTPSQRPARAGKEKLS
jgi:TetR/AcrR family transcriptional regulator, transcriptional repressor for nem operon